MGVSSAGPGRGRKFRYRWTFFAAMDGWCFEVLVLQNYLFAYALMFGYYKYRQPGRSVGGGAVALREDLYPIMEIEF